MDGQMNIKTAIDGQRRKLDCMAFWTDDLTKLLVEAQKMDRMIEIYESRQVVRRTRKNA